VICPKGKRKIKKLKETVAAKVVFARNPVSQFCSACGLSTEPDVANLI
jgi:hypothetical protein